MQIFPQKEDSSLFTTNDLLTSYRKNMSQLLGMLRQVGGWASTWKDRWTCNIV